MATTKDGILISGNKSILDKEKSILEIEENVFFNDKFKGITIDTQKAIYYKNKNLLITTGNTKTKVEDKYDIIGTDLKYDINLQIIESNKKTKLIDIVGNIIEANKFNYDIEKNIIKASLVTLFDTDNNIYYFKEAVFKTDTNEILGKDISVDFENSLFGYIENEPRLKGNSLVSNIEESKIYKGIFTTCSQNGDKCPSWSLEADEVKHEKQKKTISYKHAWLKVFDTPVLYFPHFFHPDPTVKRQSGLLTPSIMNSSFSGQSVQIPYFKVISEDKDLTVTPRLFFDNNFIIQTEYRQANKNSDGVIDLSLNRSDGNTKAHFFSNLAGYVGQNEFELNLQRVNNDKYLKIYDIQSPIINDVNTLNSFIKFKKIGEDYTLKSSVEIYENLSKLNNDRYEYVFPNYSFTKNIKSTNIKKGSLNFNSTGFQKKYNTNVYEANIINDLIYNSNSFIMTGLLNKYEVLLKNVNTNADNSSNYKNETQNKLLSKIMFESKYPMVKYGEIYEKNLTPIISARYSPTETKNLSNLDRRVSYNNIFSLNRLGENDTVEGGKSITLGVEYSENKKNTNEYLSIGLASVLRDVKNEDLPKKTTLGEKRSDIFGKVNFSPSNYLDFQYDFSLDKNLHSTNYNLLNANLNINNFFTFFEFLEEDNIVGNKSYITNKTGYNFDSKNSLTFSTSKNLDKGIDEYYNLIYEYKDDCMIASVEYNKTFYTDGELTPQNNIFFMLRIIPFGDVVSPSTPIYTKED